MTMDPLWQRHHNSENIQVTNDPLAVIYNENQWRFNKVSPLYNLHYSPVKLKQYAAKIRQSLSSSVTSNSSTKYSVNIVPQPSLKYSEEDPDGLMITVTSNHGKVTKVAYNCIFLSWGVNNGLDDALHLPYLIERGEQRLSYAVKTALQSIFDCSIKQYNFTQQHLLQIGFSCLDHDTSRHDDPFTLVYRTQADLKDKLSLQFNISDMLMIWNGVKEEFEEESKQYPVMYHVLKEQILHTFELNISELELCEVNMPKSEVKSNGTVKMRTPETVNCVFTILNDICDMDFTKS